MSGQLAGETDDVVAEIEFLSRSANRVRILETLRSRGPMEKRELADACDVVRTTLQRNLDDLAERDLIRRNGHDTYDLTAVGEAVAREFTDLVETTATARRLAPLLRWLPNGAFDLEVGELADADLVVADGSDPYAPVNRHVEALRRAERFRGVMSVVGKHSAEAARERIVEADADHEMVVDPGTAETLRGDPGYEDVVADALATGNYRLYVYEGEIPYYLGLTDECVQIGVEDDEGMPQALVESDSEAVRAWAEETYREFRERATEID